MTPARFFSSALGLVLSAAMAITPVAAADIVGARSVNRVSHHAASVPQMTKVAFLGRVGGVHAQTSSLIGPSGGQASVRVALGLNGGDYDGYLTVTHDGAAARYPIAYEDLVPIALFVDGQGASLYTATPGDDPERFMREAGFAEDGRLGLIAIEFKNSGFADALFYADFCSLCLGRARTDIQAQLNSASFDAETARVIQESASEADSDSYINSDIGVVYGIGLQDGSVRINGNIVRLYWTDVDQADAAFVAAREFVNQPALEAKIAAGEIESPLIDVAESPNLHRRTHFLYSTLALLRSYRASASPAAWQAFMAQLRDLSDRHPEPWLAYVAACEEVYSRSECRN